MKQTTVVTILMIVMIVFGWMSGLTTIGNNNEEEEEYDNHVATAQEYIERGLYQKAAQEYDAAIMIHDTEDLWKDKLDAYEKCYKENLSIYKEYLECAKEAVSQYSKNADFQCRLARLYITKKEYEEAYKVLKKAKEDGLEDKELDKLYLETKYAYEIEWSTFLEYRGLSNQYYAVNNNGIWIYLKEDGTESTFGELKLAGSVGEDGIRVIQTAIQDESQNQAQLESEEEAEVEKRTQLIDADKVVQGILAFEPQDVGIYSDGLIPIQSEDKYAYYNSLGDKQFGSYTMAGTFVDGEAAVQDNGVWYLINTEGEKVSDAVYEEIVLNPDYTHIKDGVMLAKKDGVYKIYKKGKEIGSYSDIDVMTDDKRIAVCINGKWGFVDLDGNELIAPAYKEAKSFSNGLAAVSNGEKWGFIDTDGTLVIDYTFEDVDYFNKKMNCLVEVSPDVWKLLTLYNKK